MASLKGYTVGLARLIGTTPDALYERQRALVRAGLLNLGEGRGPGSGVRTTGQSVALLLIAVLATDSLGETEARAHAIGESHPPAGRRCPCTGMKSFLDALAAALVSTGKARAIIEIKVSRTADRAEIRYYDAAGDERRSEFLGARATEPGLSVTATLDHNLLQQIAADVQAIVLQSFDDEGSKP